MLTGSDSMVARVLLLVAVLTCIVLQLIQGYSNVELELYGKGVLLLIGVPFALIGVLAMFLQVVTNNKSDGHPDRQRCERCPGRRGRRLCDE